MKLVTSEKAITIFCLLIYGIFFFSTIQTVPFHPDESTQIYMSHDVDILLANPLKLAYNANPVPAIDQHYRLIDSPLPRTIIGLARNIFRVPPLPSDWNWSLTWEANSGAGALPSESLLLLARISLGIFVPIGLIFFYLILRSIIPWPFALTAAVFLGMNAIFLLHTRRAMAEGISFCFYSFILYLSIKNNKNIFLVSTFAGLAILTKQIVLPVLLLPLINWTTDSLQKKKFVSFLKTILIYCGIILLIYYISNPVIWINPFRLIALQFQTRVAFSSQQAAEFFAQSSPLVANNFKSALTSWLANTFFAHPAFFDVGNYSSDLQPSIELYKSNLFNGLFSGWISGIFILILSVFGFLITFRTKRNAATPLDRPLLLLAILTILQTSFVLMFLPITFQRYYLLNLSLATMWAAIGIASIYGRLIPRR